MSEKRDTVTLLVEQIHYTRFTRSAANHYSHARISSLAGNSRGRCEADTVVVQAALGDHLGPLPYSPHN